MDADPEQPPGGGGGVRVTGRFVVVVVVVVNVVVVVVGGGGSPALEFMIAQYLVSSNSGFGIRCWGQSIKIVETQLGFSPGLPNDHFLLLSLYFTPMVHIVLSRQKYGCRYDASPHHNSILSLLERVHTYFLTLGLRKARNHVGASG